MKYTDKQRADFLELALEVGITRARRQLGYPHSWVSGKRWADAAGIELPLDEIKAQAAAHNDWYTTEELLVVVQEGLRRAQEALENNGDLDPDQQKKLAEAVQKYTNTWLLLQGKANSISERRETLPNVELLNLFEQEEARNHSIEKKEDKSYQDLELS
jgi:hypothetical protein